MEQDPRRSPLPRKTLRCALLKERPPALRRLDYAGCVIGGRPLTDAERAVIRFAIEAAGEGRDQLLAQLEEATWGGRDSSDQPGTHIIVRTARPTSDRADAPSLPS